MPRSRSSGALSISSNGVNSAMPFSACRFVMAAVRVVLPWSMWPIVPMFTWGFVRSNFFLPMILLPVLALLARDPGDDLLRYLPRHLRVRVELHRAVRGAALGPGAQVGRVAEELGQRHQHPDHLLAPRVVDPLDPA